MAPSVILTTAAPSTPLAIDVGLFSTKSTNASNLFTTEINSVVNANGKRSRFSSGNIYRKEIDAFVDLVENRPTSIARGVDGAAVVRMTEGAIQSDMSGRTVELEF